MAQEHKCLATWLAGVPPLINAADLTRAFQDITGVRMGRAGRAYLTFSSAEAVETAIRASETLEISRKHITVTRITNVITDIPAGPKKRRCSRCGRTGHNIRTCPVPEDDDDRSGTSGKRTRTMAGMANSSTPGTRGRNALRGS